MNKTDNVTIFCNEKEWSGLVNRKIWTVSWSSFSWFANKHIFHKSTKTHKAYISHDSETWILCIYSLHVQCSICSWNIAYINCHLFRELMFPFYIRWGMLKKNYLEMMSVVGLIFSSNSLWFQCTFFFTSGPIYRSCTLLESSRHFWLSL